jgi:hypothetical protein
MVIVAMTGDCGRMVRVDLRPDQARELGASLFQAACEDEGAGVTF